MKTKVINTINGEINVFDTIELANAHVQSEIVWFNSPNENKNGNGYNQDDFIVESVKFVICDTTQNSGKPYIAENLSNTGDSDSAWIFDSEENAQDVISANNWDWAIIEMI